MSYGTMVQELSLQVPVPPLFIRTLVNRAWRDIQRQYPGWSFLYGDAAIPTVTPITGGTATVTIGRATVTVDATLKASLNALPLVFAPTTLQFRVGTGTIYNIIGWDGNAILTLDRLYVDSYAGAVSAGTIGGGFQIFGAYYNAPAKDFIWWESIKDPVNGFFVATTMTRETVDVLDPQRFQSGWPRGVLPYKVNPQEGNFNGFPMYEIWPAPLNNQTLVGTYWRSGADFASLSSTLPAQIGEDVVIELAKMYCYEWCAANPNKVPKGDYRFLMGKCQLRVYGESGKPGMIDDYIRKDEGFSHMMLIDRVEPQFLDSLPWVSQKQAIGYFPT